MMTDHNTFFSPNFAGIAVKLEKAGSSFSIFNPSPSVPSGVTDGREQFQGL